MKKNLFRSLLSVALCAALLLLSVSFAAAAGKKYSDESVRLYMNPLENWFYVPASLPEGVELTEVSQTIRLIKTVWEGNSGDDIADHEQSATSATVTFVSGDEFLKDALRIGEEQDTVWRDGEQVPFQAATLCVDNDALTQPGRAVFRLACESENFKTETDLTLIALSWDEYPLLTAKEDIRPVSLHIGDTFDEDLVGEYAAVSHLGEIRSALGLEGTAAGYAAISLDAPDDVVGYDDSYWTRKVLKGGSWNAQYQYMFGNTVFTADVPMNALSYIIRGPKIIKPGETGQYQVEDTDGAAGRTFTLSLEGEGVTLDPETGAVTAAADTEASSFVLTATPSDGQPAVTMKASVGSGVLAGVEFAVDAAGAYGFTFSYPPDFRQGTYYSGGVYWESTDAAAPNLVTLDYVVYNELEEFCEDPDVARSYYPDEEQLAQNGIQALLNEEIMSADGHPARIIIFEAETDTGERYSMGFLYYTRNNRIVRSRVFSEPQNGTSWEELPKVTREDMVRVFEGIGYDPADAPITVQDAAITLATKEGTGTVTAGKKLNFTAAFADPEKVSKKNKNDAIEWSVSGASGAALPAGVSINKNGVLSTGKTDEVLQLEVTATSPVFHVSATFPVTVIPAVKKISVEPAELYFYVGTDAPQDVKAVLDPDTVPPLGITWTPAKKDIVEITPDGENGTAVIRPLAAGKTTVAVKEPGGKNAKLTVNVVEPVQSVELAVNGKPKPGSTVTMKETIAPKQAGNRNVEWSVNVGEDIATISKGKLKISKTAPVGTVITVTCTAVGAPEPVVATIDVEVIEK